MCVIFKFWIFWHLCVVFFAVFYLCVFFPIFFWFLLGNNSSTSHFWLGFPLGHNFGNYFVVFFLEFLGPKNRTFLGHHQFCFCGREMEAAISAAFWMDDRWLSVFVATLSERSCPHGRRWHGQDLGVSGQCFGSFFCPCCPWVEQIWPRTAQKPKKLPGWSSLDEISSKCLIKDPNEHNSLKLIWKMVVRKYVEKWELDSTLSGRNTKTQEHKNTRSHICLPSQE